MKLKCKQNAFEKMKKVGISLMSREVKEEKKLNLTVGKEYLVQVCSRINKDNLGSIMTSNAFLETEFFLLVFSDKNHWESITLSDIIVSEHLKHEDLINQLLKTVFENP